MRNLIRALRGKPVELSPKQQEKMAKAQAKADRIIAEREAAGRKAMEDAAAFMATQGGGASVGGPTQAQPPSFDPSQPLPPMREVFKQAFDHAKDSFGEMFDDRAGIIDPGPGANMNKPPPELEDAAEREQWAASEREARDEARAPYLAATPPAVELTRFATTGRTQFEEVDRAAAPATTPRGCSASTACPTASSSTATARTRSASSGRSRMRPARRPRARRTWLPSTAPATGSRDASASRRCSTRTSPARSCAAPTCSPRTASASRACFTSAPATPTTGSPGTRTSTASSSSAASRWPMPTWR